MKKLITITMVLMLAGFMFAQPRMGQNRPQMAQNEKAQFGRGCSNLDLTDQQTSQLQELRGEHNKAMIPLRADLKVKKIELKELIADGKSKKSIDAKQNSISKIQFKMANVRTDHLIKVRNIVGEDNFKKMGVMKKHHSKKNFQKKSMGCKK
jgi:Spy/CpxP family protein refolding chaperone